MKFIISLSVFLSNCLCFASIFDCNKIHLDQKTYQASLFINDEFKGSCDVSFTKDQEIPRFFFQPGTSEAYNPLKSYSFSVASLTSAGKDSFAGLENYSQVVLLQIETMCYLAWYNENHQLDLRLIKSFDSKNKSFTLAGDAPSTSNPDENKVESTWERKQP